MEEPQVQVPETQPNDQRPKPVLSEAEGANDALLPLDGQRAISFKDRLRAYTLYFSRITAEDWRRFFSSVRVESEKAESKEDGKQSIIRVDYESAGLELVELKLVRADGYRMKDGSDFLARPDWKQLISPGHKQQAARLLMDVQISGEDDADAACFDPSGLVTVMLDAAWGSTQPGKMAIYKGLAHTFNPPALEHERRFRRGMSESRIIGGSRTGRTIHPSKHLLLTQIYDELVVSVSGYAIAGRPLEGAVEIRQEMDGWHKISAMAKLFAGPEEQEEQEEEKPPKAA